MSGEWLEVPSLFISEDEGQIWKNITPNFSISTIVIYTYENKIFAASPLATKFGLYLSNDKGNTWIDISEGLSKTFIKSLFSHNGSLFAGTAGASVWQIGLDAFNPPAQPSTITGSFNPCVSSMQTYSVTNIPRVTYTWQVSQDWVISNGQGTNAIIVSIGTNLGSIYVAPSNPFGSGVNQSVYVTTSSAPSQPSQIIGPLSLCVSSTHNYSVPNAAGIDYVWELPSD